MDLPRYPLPGLEELAFLFHLAARILMCQLCLVDRPRRSPSSTDRFVHALENALPWSATNETEVALEMACSYGLASGLARSNTLTVIDRLPT